MRNIQTAGRLPCHRVPAAKAPGHWILARAGKRVLRPGGVELTSLMLAALQISRRDTVIELAPGLGHTAKRVIALGPASYVGVDREESVVHRLNAELARDGVRFVDGSAEDTGLPGETATVLYGEAMLSMQPPSHKKQIVEEAWRLLQPGGRYAIHELCVDGMNEDERRNMEADLARVIHHGVRLLSTQEWRDLMRSVGFEVTFETHAPMRLLEPARVLRDEGFFGAIRFAANLLLHPDALRRVLAMRATFRRYQGRLRAISLVSRKEY